MSISKGITLDLSDKLTEREKKSLIKFVARVSETSYRRGFQQGCVLHDRIQIDPVVLRYERNIDQAPWGETAKRSGFTAIDRLDMEHWEALRDIGLWL